MEFPEALFKLNEIMRLQDAGCPIGRHELTNTEWLELGILKLVRMELEAEERKAAQE